MEPAAAEAVAVGGGRLLPLLPLMLPLPLLVGAAAETALVALAACEAAAAAALDGELESEVDDTMVLGLRFDRAADPSCCAAPAAAAETPKGGEGAD
jgi:hypothetical protein